MLQADGLVYAPTLENLYGDNHSWLQGWLRGRVGNTTDAADLAQDVFLRLLMRPPARDFQNRHQARSYLCKMANGLYINLWHRREIERAWVEALAALPEDSAPSAEHQVMILQALQEVGQMLQSLPDKVAEAFLLGAVCSMTDKEIAERLHVSTRMIRKYMARAMLACMELKAASL